MLTALIFATIPFNLASWGAQRDDRFALSGPEITVESDDGLFLVHYTLEGKDEVVGDRLGAHPLLVWGVLRGLLDGRLRYEDQGYLSLVGDDGSGGSNQIDIYVKDIDANGYANAIAPGDPEDSGASCFMRISSTLADGDITQSVTAHELHHCIQYRYTTDAEPWIYEASATFEQYGLYNDLVLNLALGVLWGERISHPEWPMNSTTSRYEYAGLVFMLFWEEFGGADHGRVVRLWEILAEEPRWRLALDTAAEENWNIDFATTFLEYSSWNAFACASDDGAHYGERLACLGAVSVPMSEATTDGAEFAVDLPEVTHTAAYVTFPADGDERPVALSCEALGVDDAELVVRLHALDQNGTIVEHVDSTSTVAGLVVSLTSPIPRAGSVLAVFASVGNSPVQATCAAERLALPTSEPSCGCASGPAGGAAFLALFPMALLRRRMRTRRV